MRTIVTKKQTTTLVLFAQNYSLPVIAKKQRVSLSTIRGRIRALSKNHQREFNNALALRDVYRQNKKAIKNPKRFSNFQLQIMEIIEKF